MTASRDPDRLIQAFLREGDEELQDPVYDAVRSTIEQTRQRAGFGPWRFPTMNRFMAVGAGAVAVLAILFAGAQLFGSPGGFGGPGDATATPEASVADPTAQPTPEASVSESAMPPETLLPVGPFALFDPAAPLQPDWLDPEYDDGPPITVTIPVDGWVFTDSFNLLKGDEVGNLAESMFSWTSTTHGVLVYGDPCQWATTTPDAPATTTEEIVAALAAQPSRDASDPVPVTIGGYPAHRVTLHVPDDAVFSDCDRGEFASFTLDGLDGPWRSHDGPGQIDTFWVVDVDGATVIINAMYRPDTSAERIEEMRSIAESATFEAP